VLDIWVVVGVVALLAVAVMLRTESVRHSTAALATALTGGTLLETGAILGSTGNALTVRAFLVIVALSAGHLLLAAQRRTALAGWLQGLALGLAGLVALVYFGVASTAGGTGSVPFEAITLPIALAWAAGGVLHLTRDAENRTRSGAAVWSVAGGLLLALAPSAIVGAHGSLLRPILTVALSGLVLLAASRWRAPISENALRPILLAATAVSFVLAIGARAVGVLGAATGSVPGEFEVWVITGVVVLVAAAIVLRSDWPQLSTAMVATALAGGTFLQLGAMLTGAGASASGTGGSVGMDVMTLRAILVVVALSAGYLVLTVQRRAGLAGWLTPLALGLAGVVALVYFGLEISTAGVSSVPFELITVPIALAWIAGGVIHLWRTPTARSWPWLGGGIALLLVPSLLADFSDSPLWRVVGLGILTLAVMLGGLRARMQAPFVIGAVVVLVHTLAQLWPWLSSLYNPTLWWLWFGLGGVLLIALAARYEKRMQNVRDASALIGAMR
jgi:hypothetical protein